jgi:hypothetical protein
MSLVGGFGVLSRRSSLSDGPMEQQLIIGKEFLSKVTPGVPRETEVQSIDLQGDRALVTCIVTMKSPDGDNRFHNMRLFVRHEGQWKLLGWANEKL